MCQANQRRMITYWVRCDCRVCLEKINPPFICLGLGFDTDREAQNALKDNSPTHTSCFVAKEVLEAVNEKPKQRKAA